MSRAIAAVPWRSCSVSLCLVLFVGSPGASADVGQKVRLSWVRGPGAATCIDQPALEERIAARLGRAAFERDSARSVEAYVAREAHAWHADIHVRDASTGREATRELASESESCAALEAAVALAIALVIDPDMPASAPPLKTPILLPTPVAVTRPAPQPEATAPARETTPSASFALRGTLASGLLPGAAGGIEATSSLAFGGWLVPSASAVFLPEHRTSDLRFGFGLTALGLGACARSPERRTFAPGICANLWAGALHAVVYELTPLRPGQRAWAAASLAPSLRMSLGSRLFIEIGAEAMVPLIRDSFQVDGWPEPVFQESLVATRAFAGIGGDFR